MVTPAIASDRATVHTHLQLRWDLRAPATPENFDGNGGGIPDLTRMRLPLPFCVNRNLMISFAGLDRLRNRRTGNESANSSHVHCSRRATMGHLNQAL